MDLKILPLGFNFAMNRIIHKIFVLIKNHLSYFKDNIFEFFLKKYVDFSFWKNFLFSSRYIMIENPRSEQEKITKVTRNLFRLKKEQSDIAIKDIRNLFRLKKELKELKKQYLEILTIFLSMK